MDIDARALEALSTHIKIKFVDREPYQTVQVEGFKPIYFPGTAKGGSENLPGECCENIRHDYANPDELFEPSVTAFFIWLSDRWPVLSMIDVGALYGQIGLTAASIFNRSHIHLIEMNPFVAEILQGNVDLNRHLNADYHVVNMLMSNLDKMAPVTFKHYTASYVTSEGGSNLSSMKIVRENLKSKLRKILRRPTRGEYIKKQMRIATIDTYCHEHNFIPNLIKVDVEGSEYDVLSGAQNTLLNHHPVLLVEFHTPRDANYVRKSNRELVRMLEKLKYQCLYGDHRVANTKLQHIDSQTDINIEMNSMGIFY